MLLTEFSKCLKKISYQVPLDAQVIGKADGIYLPLGNFYTYPFANTLNGYFVLSKESELMSLSLFRGEIQKQLFLFQFCPKLSLMSPQTAKLTRKDTPNLKHLEIRYNKKNNCIIIY